MRIGINGTNDIQSLDRVLDRARLAQADGFATYWLGQIFGTDALTALAVAGREIPGIEMGTAVVPVHPRHPQMLAAQALTVQQAIGGRLALGIGLSHQIVVENMWGYSFEDPLRYMREYLDALVPLLNGQPVNVHGEVITAVGGLDLSADPPPLLLAALGPKMLRLAGSRGAGTITWCTGPRTLADHIVPTITVASEEAGFGEARVVAGLPISVTTKVDETRELATNMFAIYGGLPSYRAMLDREGVAGPADLAIIGDESTAAAGVRQLVEAGVTDFAAVELGVDKEDRLRTRAFLESRL